jgi:hypothetical protein
LQTSPVWHSLSSKQRPRQVPLVHSSPGPQSKASPHSTSQRFSEKVQTRPPPQSELAAQ